MNAKTTNPIIDDMGGNGAATAFEALMTINRPMIATMTQLNSKFIEQAARVNNEWLGFINRRLKEDMAASQRIMECKNVQDLFAAYSDFFQRAQQQYQVEFQYFARLNQKLADETASVVKSHMDDASAEIRH